MCGHSEAMGGRTLDCVGGTPSVGEESIQPQPRIKRSLSLSRFYCNAPESALSEMLVFDHALKCPLDGRARAPRTHSRQPNRRRHARVTPAPADEGRGRAQHDGKEADERTAAAVATARVGDRRECLDAMHRHVPPDRCSEAARMIPKNENPEKPYNNCNNVDSNRANMLR